jgi:C-terminal processing protease CtpA/Prc
LTFETTVAATVRRPRRSLAGLPRPDILSYRNGPRHTDFTPLRPLEVVPAGAKRFTGPVIVLANRRVASAAEDFTLAMRVRPNTEVVGDTTLGGLGNPLQRVLPNGWTYRVPQWIEYDIAMQIFEGVGIPPAVAVMHSTADSTAGRDPQLEAGIARARLRIP